MLSNPVQSWCDICRLWWGCSLSKISQLQCFHHIDMRIKKWQNLTLQFDSCLCVLAFLTVQIAFFQLSAVVEEKQELPTILPGSGSQELNSGKVELTGYKTTHCPEIQVSLIFRHTRDSQRDSDNSWGVLFPGREAGEVARPLNWNCCKNSGQSNWQPPQGFPLNVSQKISQAPTSRSLKDQS